MRDLRTYQEWQYAGYQVTKGQKAVGRNKNGEAVFDIKQTTIEAEDQDDYYGYEDASYDAYAHDIGDR